MKRRDVPKALLASTAGSAFLAQQAQAQTCTQPCYPQTAFESAAGVTPSSPSYPPGNVLRYAAAGATEFAAAVTQCLASNAFCYFPRGTYSIGMTVNVSDGQRIFGDTQLASIVTSPAGVKTFVWNPPGTGGDRYGPIFNDLTINSDFAITLNNREQLLADSFGDSPCTHAEFARLTLTAVTPSTGYGICASKMFDSVIRDCLIQYYATCLILHGCDINEICNNRIVFFSTYGILDQSGQTFGSQNDIHHNDILASLGTTAIYIKAANRHVSIHDNYLEKSSGACGGFIDASAIGAPAFGNNQIQLPYSIVIRDNRVDGEAAGNFVYRLDTAASVSTVCDNRSTSGVPGTSLMVRPVAAVFNVYHRRSLRIHGETWGPWHGYESKGAYIATAKGFTCNGETIAALIDKDQNTALQILARAIVLPASFSGYAWIIPNALTITNDLFAAGAVYTATVVARSTASSGDILRIAMGSNAHGDQLNSFSLTDQFRRFSWTFGGRPRTGSDFMGAYFTRSGASGDIQILEVSWEMQ
jgi:hypothetical protein